MLAGALCSLSEALLCEAGDAVDAVAEECRALLARAAKLDPTSPEPLQARPLSLRTHAHCLHHH